MLGSTNKRGKHEHSKGELPKRRAQDNPTSTKSCSWVRSLALNVPYRALQSSEPEEVLVLVLSQIDEIIRI